MITSDKWIETKEVTKMYSSKIVLNKVDLKLEKGVTLIFGKNGSGKSTLLSIIEGLNLPTSGTVKVFGMDPVKNYNCLTRKIACLPERATVYGDDKVKEFFKQYFDFNGHTDSTFREISSIFEVEPLMNVKFSKLSLGEMQLVLLTAILSTEREAYILDEPNSNLDQNNRIRLWKLVYRMAQKGKKFLIVSHLPDEVVDIADEILFFKSGELFSKKSPQDYWLNKNKIYKIMSLNPDILIQKLSDLKPEKVKNGIRVKGFGLGEILGSLQNDELRKIFAIETEREDNEI